MKGLFGTFLTLAACVLLMDACSSAPAKKSDSSASEASAAAMQKEDDASEPDSPQYPQNLDVAHAAYLQAVNLEMRGAHDMADALMMQAYEADPGNRYLGFEVADRIAMRGDDSLALVYAQQANRLKGKKLARQYALLAHLYVKDGSADSARKYFNLGLDSSHYQDMALLYDYSLFLEIVKDKKELVRVYDLLLPQVNYMPSLFQRQFALLVEMNKDSALVDLLEAGYAANRDRAMLLQMVQILILQKRIAEARAIADTVMSSDEVAEKIIVGVMTAIAEKNRDSAHQFLKHKYYTDSVRTPILTNFLGHYEYIAMNLDSAKVHLKQAAEQLGSQPVYVANAYRALASIALSEDDKKSAVLYAEKADSASMGGEKPMLAMTYGYVGEYRKAYAMLDSLLAVWSKWNPPVGVDSASANEMRKQASRMHRQFRNAYARIYTFEASDIEKNASATDSMKSYAKEARERAELFWESLLLADSSDMGTRVYMAMNLERMGRYDESFALFELLLKQPESSGLDFPEIMNYYGYSLIDMNRSAADVDRGLALVQKALDKTGKAPAREAYLDSKAWGLYRKGLYKQAYDVMLLIDVKNMLEDAVYWEHIGAIQAALGMKAEATKSYKTLLKLNPNHPDAKAFFSGKKQ
ncbi:MAG: hypothetical protein J6W54_08805 [Fibrobacter sp.]|uniref:tetratricopeptide repeat protein n=1 Tax=Fibrobacter sp. TaxID=35828 RepID=UPI001B205163|nr:hypothetical protein [Fibrobacter sp.]MBO7061172.1 hypothetical protein [Fibrobacter sp.]